MSDHEGGLNTPVQQPASQGTTPKSSGKTSSFGTRPAGQSATPSDSSSDFFSYKHDDGEELKFKSPDDLKKYIREGTLRHKDYTKKTQEAAELRKQIDSQREKIETQAQMAARMENKWKPVDDWLLKRPDVVEYIRKNMGQESPQAILEQSRSAFDENLSPIKSELEQLKAWKEEQESQAKFSKTMSAIKEQYPDLDEDAVKEMYRALDEAPEGDEIRSLLEVLHFASKGKNGFTQVRSPVTPGARIPQSTQAPFKPGERWNPDMAKKRMRDMNHK
jgi:hypothetical protein